MSSTAEKTNLEILEEGRRLRRERILAGLRERSPKCFLCKWILEDIEKNGTLTGYPLDAMSQATFPRAGKVAHLKIEGLAGLD